MMRLLINVFCIWASSAALGETLIAARTISSQQIISTEDITFKEIEVSGAFRELENVVGMEARVAIYAGRPIRRGDIVAPALVERNQIVTLSYTNGALSISVEARALGRGSAGESLRFMNLGSRSTISGTILADGSIVVEK